MDPLRNPYTPGAGVRPPALEGRSDEISSFRTHLERIRKRRHEQSLLITGLRGVGKTVLLNAFADIAQSLDLKTAQVELQADSELRAVVARMARTIVLALSPTERMKDRVRRALGILKAFTLGIPDGPTLNIDIEAVRGTADSGDLAADLSDLLCEVGDVAARAGSGALLLFDEVQHLEKKPLSALIAALHRVAQKSLPLTVVAAGLPLLPRLAGSARSYAERLFRFTEIGSLRSPDADAALRLPAKSEGADFSDEALVAIIAHTEGYPYFLQEFGKHVWNKAPKSPIGEVDVAAALPEVMAALDAGFFRVRIERATHAEQRLMRAMAELGDGPYQSGAIAMKMGSKVTSVAPIRAGLMDKGLIYSPRYGEAQFTVPMFAEFLRRTYPFPWKP